MRVRRLDHVLLAMPAGRETDARNFYAGILGIPETKKPAELAGRGGCWFEDGELKVHLGLRRILPRRARLTRRSSSRISRHYQRR